MSGELEITSGGAISVDPEQMRAVAERMSTVAARLSDAGESVRRAHQALASTWSGPAHVDLSALWAGGQALVDEGDALASQAVGTGRMADAFELADLRSRQQMLAVEHPAEADRLQERIDELVASYPDLDAMAVSIAAGWEKRSQEGMFERPLDEFALGAMQQSAVASLGLLALVPLRLLTLRLGDVTDAAGSIPPGRRVAGGAPPVAVAQVSRSSVDGPATTLTQLVHRLPGGEAQVAVDKRTHRDGSVSYVVYVDGTRSLRPTGEEPWDMGSNWDLYAAGEQSAAYAATLEALRLAGAEPGARVDVVGYSQGAAIAGAIAMSGVYETSRVMVVGSPTVPALDADQTLIRAFHTDDPVGAGLSGGGPVGATGSAESVTISREYATHGELTSVQSHFREAYDQTLDLADKSGDTRITALHESLEAEADDIVSVERSEYRATRP